MRSKQFELATECKRQSENCLYTATSFTLWLKFLRCVRVTQIAAALLLGSFAGWKLIEASPSPTVQAAAAIAAFIAALLPTLLAALKVDDRIEDARRLSAEFTNLRDRFRHAALVHSKKPFAEFEKSFGELMDRTEQARAAGLTPPEYFFRSAQKKIKTGDYAFEVDIPEAGESPE